MALVAAIAPKSCGSSTIGMKKSVVATTACVALSWYTAASSEVSVPTSSPGVAMPGIARARRSRSAAGATLQPQPPPCESDVRRGEACGRGATAAGDAEASSAAGMAGVDSRVSCMRCNTLWTTCILRRRCSATGARARAWCAAPSGGGVVKIGHRRCVRSPAASQSPRDGRSIAASDLDARLEPAWAGTKGRGVDPSDADCGISPSARPHELPEGH